MSRYPLDGRNHGGTFPSCTPAPYRMATTPYMFGGNTDSDVRFHGFFQQSDDYDGPSIIPVAVVELADGRVSTVPAGSIRFTTGLVDTDTDTGESDPEETPVRRPGYCCDCDCEEKFISDMPCFVCKYGDGEDDGEDCWVPR